MTDVRFYKNNIQKTFEEIAKLFFRSYPMHTSKTLWISKQFYDYLNNYNTRSAMETFLKTLITTEAKKELPNDDFDFAVRLTVGGNDRVFGDGVYHLEVYACDIDEDYELYKRIVETRANEKEMMDYMKELK